MDLLDKYNGRTPGIVPDPVPMGRSYGDSGGVQLPGWGSYDPFDGLILDR